MIYQKLTTGMGQCLLLIRKHADRDGFELWRRKERCWCYFNNVGAEYFKEFYKTTEYIRQTGKNWKRLEIPGSLVMMLDSGIFYGEI